MNSLAYRKIVAVLYSFIELCDIMPRGSNKSHTLDDLIKVMSSASSLKCSVGGRANSLRISNDDFPTDEWVRKLFANADSKLVEEAFKIVLSQQLKKFQKKKKLKKIIVAIDKTLKPRYDKRYGSELIKSKSKNGTSKFEAYITIQCVNKGCRLTLAVLPFGAFDLTADSVRKLVQICDENNIKIKRILMDREFFSVDVFNALTELRKNYMTPCRNTHNVVSALNEVDQGVREKISEMKLENQYLSANYIMITVKRLKPKNKDSQEPKEKYIGFAVNTNTKSVAKYRKRWGIETGYRMIEDLRMKTRSKNPAARTLCFMASVLLFNQWVLINAMDSFGEDGKWNGIIHTTLTFKDSLLDLKEPKPPPTLLSIAS